LIIRKGDAKKWAGEAWVAQVAFIASVAWVALIA
jgi:hypothetical protein